LAWGPADHYVDYVLAYCLDSFSAREVPNVAAMKLDVRMIQAKGLGGGGLDVRCEQRAETRLRETQV
jgi:hypothetical protein